MKYIYIYICIYLYKYIYIFIERKFMYMYKYIYMYMYKYIQVYIYVMSPFYGIPSHSLSRTLHASRCRRNAADRPSTSAPPWEHSMRPRLSLRRSVTVGRWAVRFLGNQPRNKVYVFVILGVYHESYLCV